MNMGYEDSRTTYLAHSDYPIGKICGIAIKSKFGGNDESKKRCSRKYILKQQFEGFTVSNSDGIHKGYERFQSLLSQLEIHGAGVSTEDANQNFLRSLPCCFVYKFLDHEEQTRVLDSLYQLVSSFWIHEDLPTVDEYDLEELDLKWGKWLMISKNKQVPKEDWIEKKNYSLMQKKPVEMMISMLSWPTTCTGSETQVEFKRISLQGFAAALSQFSFTGSLKADNNCRSDSDSYYTFLI
ncbi:hypothetical protein Tco_1237706 [Tanacetum coccineum]